MADYAWSSTIQRTAEVPPNKVFRLEYDGDGKLVYVGRASSNVAESFAGWAIMRLNYNGDGQLISRGWAGGLESFDKIWADRATYSYS